MLSLGKRNKKGIAATFLLIFTVETFYPAAAYALTSGPVQPEMQKFQPAGVSDMVDLFSGDFKYNIPLMDVGGYPVNIAYHSGSGMEEEASWVGMGWSLSPGSVNRNMRGIPDDFNGKATDGMPDMIRTAQHQKDFYKIGGQLVVKYSGFAHEFGTPSLHLDVYKDNYYGIGANIGASVNFNVAQLGATSLTAGLSLDSDPRNGVTLQPSLSLTASYDDGKEANSGSITGGFTYNTRNGLENASLGASFSNSSTVFDDYGNVSGQGSLGFGVGSITKDYSHGYTPTLGTNKSNYSYSLALDLGPAVFGGYFGAGGSGYFSTQKNNEETSTLPAFGYMNYQAGAHNTNAILDYNREKDVPFLTTAPAIPIPVATEDYFTATSQDGARQFRPWYNGEYTVFDRTYQTSTTKDGFGVTIGGGNAFQVGGRVDINNSHSITRRWDNAYTNAADGGMPASVMNEPVYFKKSGELAMADDAYYSLLNKDATQKVSLNASFSSNPQTAPNIISNNIESAAPNMHRYARDRRTSAFSYLTAAEAAQYGLDKNINGETRYARVDPVNTDPISTVHKPHHISEVTVTDEEGKRMVYGVPVYNVDQKEVSFSVAPQSTDPWSPARKTGLVGYNDGTDNSSNNTNGRFNIYNSKQIPPFATSFLLSGILSPDYVDRTGDGITDDDLGSAVRFKYQKSSAAYHWRAPYDAGKASLNEGFLSDPKDDKASYVYGTKELWYLDTIFSKTMVAVFYKSQRADGYGVAGETGGIGTGPDQQVWKLDSIRLFTRAELVSHPTQPIPIKVAHFEYDYSLYPGLPNSDASSPFASGRDPLAPYASFSAAEPYDAAGHIISLNPNRGKLTLRKIYFTFGANVRGRTNPYIFSYDMRLISSTSGIPTNPDPIESIDYYTPRQADRWGTYKQSSYNWGTPGTGNAIQHNLNNSEFPYTLQPRVEESFDTRLLVDRFASKWQLTDITVPTGGKISVEYESDDYSYVQDRKAMEECQLMGMGMIGQTTGMTNTTNINKTNKLYVKVPVPPASSQDFINTYLSGPNGQNWNNIAFKVYTDIDGHGKNFEYVIGYAEIDQGQPVSEYDVHDDIVGIPVKYVNTYNPVSKAAWQILQTDLPQLAYENYDNSDITGLGGNVTAAIRTIIQAFVNLRELTQSFDQMASGKKFANTFNSAKSMVRLNAPIGKANGKTDAVKRTYGKLGGGSRVRRVEMSDIWDNNMTGASTKPLFSGVQYDYTKKDDAGNLISSGVAAYEPADGNEENPFHEPVPFTEKVQWSQDRYHFIEKPYGESYFPAPEVGYSEVKATSYGADKPYTDPSVNVYRNTGYIISRFYTAKDFPTQVDNVPLDERTAEDDLTLLLFASKYTKRVSTSQGFKVVLNDMHGKPAFTGVYDNSDNLLSSSEYFYNVQDANAPQKKLNNTVLTLKPDDGTIAGGGNVIGTDEELVTDIRESSNTTNGTSIGAYLGLFFVIWPIPFGAVNYNSTASVTSYNSVSTIKVIHQYGILRETRTTQNGSTLTADNLLWDGLTGQVLVTRTQNEFDDYTYALSYPAHMAYDGMGAAYRNIGTLFAGLLPNGNGSINIGYSSYLSPGDEMVNTDLLTGTGIHGWVIPDPASAGNYHLVDQSGNFITTNGNYRLVRSGRRNLLGASAGTVVTMTNPLAQSSTGDYSLQAAVDKRVLASKAATYKDEWDMPVPKFLVTTNASETDAYLPGVYLDKFGGFGSFMSAFADGLFSANTTTNRRYLYSFAGDNVTLADIFGQAVADNTISSASLPGVIAQCVGTHAPPDLSQLHYYLVNNRPDPVVPNRYLILPGDQAMITWNGQVFGTITFDNIATHSYIIEITSTKPTYCATAQASGCNGTTGFVSQDFSLATTCPASGVTPDITIRWNSAPVSYSVPPVTNCTDPLNQVLNPYYQDVKGVWRMDYDHVYQVNRTQVPGNPAQTGGTNIRYSGYYSNYTPFWAFNANILSPLPEVPNSPIQHTLTDPRWEWTSKAVHFDQKSNEIESVDPLKRYSAALYGYQQTVATAVASNARQNEIAFDGFEDYNFNLIDPLSAPANPCPLGRHLEMGLSGSPATNGSSTIVSTTAHSGNYSLQLQNLNITQPAGSATPAPNALSFDAIGRYILLANEQAAGFAPVPGKNYLLSFWIKDGSDETNTITGLQININSQSQDISSKQWPVVEKWKKVEIPFTASSNGFSLSLSAGSTMYLDDLRIQPFDSQLKTFVYDDRTMRLTGQLDENNFGVFYEYDEEGTPIRVKKETERGVMTVKENRQSYKKYSNQ